MAKLILAGKVLLSPSLGAKYSPASFMDASLHRIAHSFLVSSSSDAIMFLIWSMEL